MSRVSDTRRAVRALILDAQEQCQRHMDACPEARPALEAIGARMHRTLEEMELRFSWGREDLDEAALLDSVQNRVMQRLAEMQEIRNQHPLGAQLERLPDWPLRSNQDLGLRSASA